MKEFTQQLVQVSAGERLVTTLFFAILLHGIVILGVTFSGEEPPSERGNTLEITLVNTRSDELPDNADYLADASQRGNGNTRDNVRPQAAMNSPDANALEGAPNGNEVENRLESQDDAATPDTLEAQRRQAADKQVVTQADSAFAARTDATTPNVRHDRVLVARLMTPGNELTEPVNDANQQPQARSENLREKVVAVNTRESVYARYLDGWRRSVERMGLANYPDEARREGMEGSLVLEVALNADGTLRNLEVQRRSPYPLLDEAAVRIVRLAAPFPPFTDAMKAETDVLRFRWMWKFNPRGAVGSVHAEADSP